MDYPFVLRYKERTVVTVRTACPHDVKMSLNLRTNFTNMSLHITSTTKSVKHIKPTTTEELMYIIKQELERQGPDADLNHIDTSEITNMAMLFIFLDVRNIKIDNWDVSNVKDMSSMFRGCSDFNADLSGWDVSNVEIMDGMFFDCRHFNSDLSKWNVSRVVSMSSTFDGCEQFDSDLSNWNVSNVVNTSFTFNFCLKMSHKLRPSFS